MMETGRKLSWLEEMDVIRWQRAATHNEMHSLVKEWGSEWLMHISLLGLEQLKVHSCATATHL